MDRCYLSWNEQIEFDLLNAELKGKTKEDLKDPIIAHKLDRFEKLIETIIDRIYK